MSKVSLAFKLNRFAGKTVLHCVAAMAFLAMPSLRAQQTTAFQAIQVLKLPSSKNLITVYYSPRYVNRVVEVRPLIEEMVSFYQNRLKIKADFTLAILTKEHWSSVSQAANLRVERLENLMLMTKLLTAEEQSTKAHENKVI